ncbi:hypothetical protein GCM10010329_64100 [Streptomyces spiroverticillatus]|uniref:Uncharacterized protein n=1 Tax=Streptomyces finlayi TaxID=67296 RepID=A0A918X4I5_9ACTN|nr:hypothetical protein [Streptomyces finlayi]GHA31940.1 hypothetical protein GCM10010329_64100 [Streptomyces spiroverticillatus]GHD10820.1 hypothetical protein GCM10010334_66450 [Streptomyces finlayi]
MNLTSSTPATPGAEIPAADGLVIEHLGPLAPEQYRSATCICWSEISIGE